MLEVNDQIEMRKNLGQALRRIGFVHLKGGMGAGIRCSAIQNYLKKSGFEVLDIELEAVEYSNGLLPNYLTLPNLLSIFKKACGKGIHPLIVEIAWNNELRKIKRSIPGWYQKLLDLSTQVDFFHAETYLPAYVCALVKEKTKKPFVFDMHGLQAEEAKLQGESSARLSFWERVERTVVDQANWIVVVSRAMAGFIIDCYGKSQDRFILIPNGTELYSERAQYANPLRVVYGGIFSYYERVQDFLSAAQILQGQNYEFILMGDGRLRDEMLDYINHHSVGVVYVGRKGREESLKRFSQMQIGVAPSTKDITRRVASPIKVLDYAACGLPIVTVEVGEWSNLVKQYDAGIVLGTSDPKEIATAIVQLSDKSLWIQKSSNALRMVQEACLWGKVLQPLKGLYIKWPG